MGSPRPAYRGLLLSRHDEPEPLVRLDHVVDSFCRSIANLVRAGRER
jgi:hypothetical protein